MPAAKHHQGPNGSLRPDDRSWDSKCAGWHSSYQAVAHNFSRCAQHLEMPAALQETHCGSVFDKQEHSFQSCKKELPAPVAFDHVRAESQLA